MATAKYPNAEWFDPFGICRECRNRAQGLLRSYDDVNRDFGAFCSRCAEKHLKAAKRARDAAIQPAPRRKPVLSTAVPPAAIDGGA